MLFTCVIGVLFLAIVFFHYLQGFFSATLSAIFAVLAAVLAFSWHETIVESFLQGKASSIAHATTLVVLFAAIYLLLRTAFDKLVPDGLTFPAMVDRIGGAVMGVIAGVFALGIFTIAAQELPFGSNVAGYTKYDTEDSQRDVPSPNGGQSQTGYNFDELKSDKAGSFTDTDRKQLFPLILPGVDEMVVDTVYHLSNGGSLSGNQALADVHPDFLQELYGQNIGIQGGTKHVQANLATDTETSIRIDGVYSLPVAPPAPFPEVLLWDGMYDKVRGRALVPPGLPLVTVAKRFTVPKPKGDGVEERAFQFGHAMKDMELVVIRISFGVPAADPDSKVRISPGSIRLVAQKGGVPHDYYPIGMLEIEPKYQTPVLFVDKPDDYLLLPMPPEHGRPAIDAVFAVEKAGFVNSKTKKIEDNDTAQGVFVEVKRLVREKLSGRELTRWEPPTTDSKLVLGTLHQSKFVDPRILYPTTGPASAPAKP